jgi:hypothetical protein
MTSPGSPGPVLRVRVRRSGDRWTIEKQQRIESMTLPRSAELPETQGRPMSGFWYEASTADGRTLYRRVLRNPTEQAVEVPAEDGRLQRVDMRRPEVVFDVLIPDVPEGVELRFFESDPKAGDTRATIERARQPVARLLLRRGSQGSRQTE